MSESPPDSLPGSPDPPPQPPPESVSDSLPGRPRTPSRLDPAIAARLKRDDQGLFPAVAQQWDTGRVLMLGWMDDEALHRTLTSGRVTYWSRSRQEYWRKGDASGHRQWVRSLALDCDGDTVLVQVDQEGPACHTGTLSCFDAGRLEPVVVMVEAAES
jgi:phosphoribosyl-AMP cyclohydrolase